MLLHLSFNPDLPTTLMPKQPQGSEHYDPQHFTYEDLPPRVSFAPTIEQCWMAIYKNIDMYFDRHLFPYMDMYVYAYDGTVKSIGNVIPESVMAKRVHDYHVTGEVAYTKPVRIRKVAKVRFWNTEPQAERIEYTPFNDKAYPKRLLCTRPLYYILENLDRDIVLNSTGYQLYHYSNKTLTELLTKRSYTTDQQIISLAESNAKLVGDIGCYLDHISFFLEPIPTDILPKLFGGKHPFYRPNETCIEHVVQVKLTDSFDWALQETPVIGKFSDRWNWDDITREVRRGYIRQINKEMTRLKLQGSDVAQMFDAIRPYIGETRDYFIKARQSRWAEDTSTQYAAEVPHLMLYPNGGSMKVLKSKEVRFGIADVKESAMRLLWRRMFR